MIIDHKIIFVILIVFLFINSRKKNQIINKIYFILILKISQDLNK